MRAQSESMRRAWLVRDSGLGRSDEMEEERRYQRPVKWRRAPWIESGFDAEPERISRPRGPMCKTEEEFRALAIALLGEKRAEIALRDTRRTP